MHLYRPYLRYDRKPLLRVSSHPASRPSANVPAPTAATVVNGCFLMPSRPSSTASSPATFIRRTPRPILRYVVSTPCLIFPEASFAWSRVSSKRAFNCSSNAATFAMEFLLTAPECGPGLEERCDGGHLRM